MMTRVYNDLYVDLWQFIIIVTDCRINSQDTKPVPIKRMTGIKRDIEHCDVGIKQVLQNKPTGMSL